MQPRRWALVTAFVIIALFVSAGLFAGMTVAYNMLLADVDKVLKPLDD